MIPADVQTAEVSLRGQRRNNQDRAAIFTSRDSMLLVLADGLGGHPKGEVAAQIIINIARQQFDRTMKPIGAPDRFMRAVMELAHRAIVEYGDRQRPPIEPRSTAVLALIQTGKCYWAHVGDSRLYLIRGGKIVAQTRDHSMAELADRLAADGIQAPHVAPRHAVTRCLGGPAAVPTPTLGAPVTLQPGDDLLLCSDGLWGQLDTSEIVTGVQGSRPYRHRLGMLAERAVEAGQERSDNVTLLAMHWPDNADSSSQAGSQDPDLDAAVDHLQSLITRSSKR
jgi:serine/threonine protein phosphatase PrpC